jgi:DNA-binding beta-propeller fold protein YncE
MSARTPTAATVAALCVLAGGLVLCSTPAVAARGHVFSGSFGAQGSGEGQLNEPNGVAVNESTGQVYLADKGNNRVERFSSTGNYETEFNGSGTLAAEGGAPPTGQFSGPEGIAVDNACSLHKPALTEATTPTCAEFDPSAGDVYVVDASHNVIDKFTASGAYVGQLTEANGSSFGRLMGVAVDPAGQLWVYQQQTGTSAKNEEVLNFNYAIANEFVAIRSLGLEQAFPYPAFAVDSKDNLYGALFSFVTDEYVVAETNSKGETLNEALDYESATGVAVQLSSDEAYVDNVTTVGRFSPTGALLERLGAGHLNSGSGVAVSSKTETVYVADSAANNVEVFTPEPPRAPTVEDQSVSEVNAEAATLAGQLNPRGSSAQYRFEYGPCSALATCSNSAYDRRAPATDVSTGSGFELASVSVSLRELAPNTPYHFRLAASNEHGLVHGEERTFTTQSAGGALGLPDNRAWEMVSPPDKHGAQIDRLAPRNDFEGAIQASADGQAITYMAEGATEAEPEGNANIMQIISKRGPSAWTSRDISTAHKYAVAFYGGKGQEYRFFSDDLSLGLVEPFEGIGFTPLSTEATERTPYLRHNETCDASPSSCYQPLLTAGNVPPGTKFGPSSETQPIPWGLARVVGASADATNAVLDSSVALTAKPIEKTALYAWSGGRLQLVSVLPQAEGGAPARAAALGTSPSHLEELEPLYDRDRGAVSRDGTRIVWSGTSPEGGSPHLYLRDTVKAETVRLDEPQAGVPGELSEAELLGASADGTKVFFLSEGSLYECQIVESPGGRLTCGLTDLTPEPAGGSEPVRARAALGISEDGSYVYFVAGGVLANGAAPGSCQTFKSPQTKCNLYVRHNGKTDFIAGLSKDDIPEQANSYKQPTRVSPNGRWFAFMSNEPLTGYDNRDAHSGKRDEEVFLYDASRGTLACPSCNPTGARPTGVEYAKMRLTADDRVWGSDWIAANVPVWTANGEAIARQPRYLSNTGRLFFNSHDALVPQDVNGTADVYEWEPPGVGNCSESAPTFSPRSGGCIDLISSGTSAEESAFLDASETGGDVFFLTTSKLGSQDHDTAMDVYDAHECTARSSCLPTPASPPPPCSSGDSCRGASAPQPQTFVTPPSATFSGPGNLTTTSSPTSRPSLSRAQRLARALRACHRLKKRDERLACVRRARKRDGGKAGRALGRKAGRTNVHSHGRPRR